MKGRCLDLLPYGVDTLAAASADLVRDVIPHLARPVARPPTALRARAPRRLDFVGGGISEGADQRADALAQRVKLRFDHVELVFQVALGDSHVSSSVLRVGTIRSSQE